MRRLLVVPKKESLLLRSENEIVGDTQVSDVSADEEGAALQANKLTFTLRLLKTFTRA